MTIIAVNEIRWVVRDTLLKQSIAHIAGGANVGPRLEIDVTSPSPIVIIRTTAAPNDEIIRLDLRVVSAVTVETLGDTELGTETDTVNFALGVGGGESAFFPLVVNREADTSTGTRLLPLFPAHFLIPKPRVRGSGALTRLEYVRNDNTIRAIVVARDLIAATNPELAV